MHLQITSSLKAYRTAFEKVKKEKLRDLILDILHPIRLVQNLQ